ncbi:MAG: T9SS sorting signal type C domain-containing protein [Flavobacteriales bacterium]|nr:MAG: T9SS sorting signal type C domain-containing protein [Flavobacteriales bacterium]
MKKTLLLFLLLPLFGFAKSITNYAFENLKTETNSSGFASPILGTAVACTTYSLNSVSTTDACAVGKESTVTLTSTSASLPVGTYTVEYRLSYNGYSTTYTASMNVTTAGTGTFTSNLGIMSATETTKIRITKLTSGSCNNTISANNESNTLYMAASKGTPTAYGYASCNNWVAQWNNDSVDGYYLDVAIDNGFTNYLSGYQNLYVGNVISYTLTGLARGGTYYYRVRSKNYCGTSVNSNVVSFTEKGNGSSTPGTIAGGASSICNGASTTFTVSGSNPSNGTWSIFNQTGAATITSTGTVTGTKPGTVTVVYTVGSGCVSSTTKSLTITGGTIETGATPTVCINTTLTPITHTTSGFTGIGTASGLPGGVTASFNSNVLTINGTPNVSGVFNYSIPLTGNSCGAANATGKITVTPANTITKRTSSGSNTQSVCISNSIVNIIYDTLNATGATFSGLPGGVSGNWASNVVTISGSPNAAGTFNYTVTLTGGCGNVTSTGTITVNSNKPASVSIASNQPSSICKNTQVIFTATPTNGGTAPQYQWYNGTTLISGQNGATYTTNQLTSTDAINVVMTSNATPCLTGSPATSNSITTTVITTDRGVTRGGKHICLGSANPTLTLYSYDLNNTVYPDANKVVKWQYSDDSGNTTWFDIPGTSKTVTYTPPGTLSAFRTYRAVVQNGSCNPQNAIETRVDVDPLPTPTFTASAGSISCVGTDITYTTQTGQNNYLWTVSGTLNSDYRISGGSLATNSSTVTLRWLTVGNKTVTINYNNADGCKAATATSSTTDVRATPTVPVAGTNNPATCTTAGSVTLTGLPSGTWTLTQSGTFPNTITGTGTSYTVLNLAAGTYNFTVSNGSCTSLPLSNVQIADQSTATWNGTAWAGGVTPNATKNVVFTGNYNMTADLEACSCTINSGVNVSVASGITLKITNAVNVATGANLTFENNSSLVQVNNASVNTGNITYKRISKQIRLADFTYWSTPVNPQTLYNVSQGTQYNMYMGFTGTNWQVTDRSSNMMVGKGYIIRGPQNFSNTSRADYQASFVGVPNNGNLSGETLDANKFYLIGNPYPSALDASKFLAGNLFMKGTLYFWTHNTPVVLGGAYQYNADDYASFNLTGGVGTSASTGNSGNNNTTPSGYIAAGQAFFASAASTGTVVFNNDMREGGARNGQFFKPAKTGKEATTEKHRIWLNMTNDGGVFKQMLVGYVDGATNSQDMNYDGETFDGNVYLDFYSVNQDLKFAIQGRALPFADSDEVPLGYRTTIDGDLTISIDQADGDLETHAVYIEDKTTGIIHDLKAGKFTFTTSKGTFADRFVLRYTNKTLGTGDFENTENNLIVSVKNKVIKVNSAKESIKTISIFDITGKTLYTKNKIDATEFQISNLQSANQVLFIKTTLFQRLCFANAVKRLICHFNRVQNLRMVGENYGMARVALSKEKIKFGWSIPFSGTSSSFFFEEGVKYTLVL